MINILLPIETINREIDFRVMMASILSGKGYKIYIGQHDFLMSLLPGLKNGIYIGKNIFNKRSDQEQGEKYLQLKEKGIDIIYLHEEGAVYAGGEENWKQVLQNQYNLNLFDCNDTVCVWGKFQMQVDKERSEGVKVAVTGHPRFDLYKKHWNNYFSNDVKNIREKHGNYILINGNYGAANHGLGVQYVFSNNFNYKVEDIDARLNRVGFYSYSTKQLVSIVELTHRLAVEYPKKTFIYRPHPSEDQEYYKAVFGGVNNILVNHEGAVGAWILGADAVIHDGCTTAIEATLAGIPVINYKPLYSKEYDIWLPNQLGKRAESVSEVINLLDNISAFEANYEDSTAFSKICGLFHNFEGDSFEKVIDLVETRAVEKSSNPSESPSARLINTKYIAMRVKQEAVKILKNGGAKESDYHKRKFYGFTNASLSDKFKQAGLVLGKTVNYKIYNPYLIEVK